MSGTAREFQEELPEGFSIQDHEDTHSFFLLYKGELVGRFFENAGPNFVLKAARDYLASLKSDKPAP